MSIALFAIIGAVINPGVAYWIIFALYCAWRFLKISFKILDKSEE